MFKINELKKIYFLLPFLLNEIIILLLILKRINFLKEKCFKNKLFLQIKSNYENL
jgi:hypothetical protein